MPPATSSYDFSKVSVDNDGMVDVGNGQKVNKNSLDDAGYKAAVDTKSKATPSPLIVTSGSSRSTYANNTSTIQGAVSNLSGTPRTYTGQDGKTYNSDTGEVVDTTKTDKGGSATPAGNPSVKNADGSTTTTNPDGTTSTSPNFTNIDPSLKAQYDESVKTLDQNIASAKATLEAATATLQNDPAATAAINQIYAKFDQQIQLMKDKNNVLMGSYVKSAARNGGLQYAPDMTTNFLSEEQDKATQRVADLITQETTAVLKAQQAYKDGDVKAFNAATKSYQDASKQKTDAINKLLTASDKVVKEQQAQQRIDQAAAKNVVARDTKLSTSLASNIADQISKSGLTDQKTIDAFIDQMATKSGISDPEVLRSAVVKARQDLEKSNLSLENTKSIINKRNQPKDTKAPGNKTTGGGTDGTYKYSGDDIGTYSSFLQKGGKAPDGSVYNGRGSDTYVDPGAYTAIYNDWVANGGTPQGFLKKFPISNVNPDSYPNLPAGLQPKTK